MLSKRVQNIQLSVVKLDIIIIQFYYNRYFTIFVPYEALSLANHEVFTDLSSLERPAMARDQ